MQEFAADLQHLQQRPEARTAPVAYKKRATERAGSTRPRRIPRGILITAAALIAGLVPVWYVWTARPGSHLPAPTLTVVPLTSFRRIQRFRISVSRRPPDCVFLERWQGRKRRKTGTEHLYKNDRTG